MSLRTMRLGNVSSTICITSEQEVFNHLQRSSFVLVDRGIIAHVLPVLTKCRVKYLIVPAGEAAKSRSIFDAILHAFFSAHLQRHHEIAAIGGGALCDVAAFASSVYMRGLTLRLFPSTLLAMVDAAIGGKTSINYGTLKNMIGTFYPAHEVVIAPAFLDTLSLHHIRCGLAEIIKAGMLGDNEILTMICENESTIMRMGHNGSTGTDEHSWWNTLIWKAANVKMNFVESDFTEKGARAFLNLGHTFAHAIETESKTQPHDIRWDHGNAVALGIRSALKLGHMLGITDTHYCQNIFKVLDIFQYPSSYSGFSATRLISHMKKDKKNIEDTLRFVLQKTFCNTTLKTVALQNVQNLLRNMGANT